MAGSKAGAYAIILAIEEICATHLDTYVAEIEAEQSTLAVGYVDTPDSTHGITRSRLFGRDTHSALTIFKSDGFTPPQARGLSFPVRTVHSITVRVAWTGSSDTETETGLNILTRAVEAVIMERWSAYYVDTCWYDTEVSSIEDAASIRAQNQELGWFAEGQDGRNLTDYAEITFLCRQSVQRSRFTTK